jgi:hypothetical protein
VFGPKVVRISGADTDSRNRQMLDGKDILAGCREKLAVPDDEVWGST